MDIKKKQATWNKERPLFELNFVHSSLLEYFNFNSDTGDYELVDVTPSFVARDVVYEIVNTGWAMWLRAKCNAKSQAVPEGFVLLPKEPTHEMIEAGMGNFCFPLDNGRFYNHDLIFAYRAMIEAREQSHD